MLNLTGQNISENEVKLTFDLLDIKFHFQHRIQFDILLNVVRINV